MYYGSLVSVVNLDIYININNHHSSICYSAKPNLEACRVVDAERDKRTSTHKANNGKLSKQQHSLVYLYLIDMFGYN